MFNDVKPGDPDPTPSGVFGNYEDCSLAVARATVGYYHCTLPKDHGGDVHIASGHEYVVATYNEVTDETETLA